MANVFLNDLKLQKVWDAIRKNFYPVPPESGTAQPPTPAMEGDITIAFGRYTSGQYQGYLNSIVSTIGDGKVTTSKLADSAVTKAKLAAGAIDPVVTWGNGTTAGPTITIQAGKDTSVPKAVPAATAEYSGIITTTTQTMSGNKTFKGNILGEQNIEALFGVSAHGHADLSIAAGGGAGTVTCISVNDAVKEPDGTGMITLDDYPTLTAYNADKTQINSAISQINSKIPIAATASNQLADKEFVNSSINTATATFRGTYTAASDTEAAAQTALAGITTKDLNDYAFVKVENTPQTGIDKYKRYKYNGNNWVYEYTLNNSSFTASQWDAINSTITSAKVAAFNAKYDKPATGIPATDLDSQIQTLLVLASTALQRVDFFNLGDHDTPVYFNAHGYGQVIDALSVPGNIESTGGGVAAHGHADLGISAGGGSGTTTAVRIGNGSPIEAVDGVVTIPTTQISQQPDGTIALGGVAIAVKGLGSFAYRSSINLSEVVGATDVVSSLSNAIGQTHAMAEDNSENIAEHDERITDLETAFDGSSVKYALDADKVDGHHASEFVGALGVSGNNLTWTRIGGTAQAITVPYATNAGQLGGVALSGLFTLLANDDKQLSATIGGVNKKLTLDYAKKSTILETEPLPNQEFIFRNSPKTIGADSLKLDRILGKTLVWNQLGEIVRYDSTFNVTNIGNGQYKFTCLQNNSRLTFYITKEGVKAIDNHLVYVKLYVSTSNDYGTFTIKNEEGQSTYSPVAKNTFLFTSDGNTGEQQYQQLRAFTQSYVYNTGDEAIISVRVCDLTLFFNGNIPTGLTAETFERDYGYLFVNPTYNPGQLINNSAEGLETVGFNIWDEEVQSGYWAYSGVGDTPVLTAHQARVCAKNKIRVLPNKTYCVKPYCKDAKNYEAFQIAYLGMDGKVVASSLGWQVPTSTSYFWTFTTPVDCYYILVSSTYKVVGASQVASYTASDFVKGFNINISDSNRNGQYEPYKRNVLDLHLDAIQVKSPNIWDEEWEVGAYDNATGNKINDNYSIRSKNKIPIQSNASYYCYFGADSGSTHIYVYYYDKDGVFIPTSAGSRISGGSFISPSNAFYMTFRSYGGTITTYNNDICINISDPGFNGKYFPYGVLTFNGLKQAGSVRDEIVGNKFVKRVETADLSQMAWIWESGNSQVYSDSLKNSVKDGVFGSAGVICDKLEVNTNGYAGRATVHVRGFNYKYLYISTPSQLSASDFVGYHINYELATYETYDLVAPIPTAMPAGTTERRLPEDTSDLVLAPFACDMTYGTNPGDILASGIAWEKIWGRPTIVHDKSNVSLTTLDRHVIKIGDKELYLIFSVGSDGTSYTLRVATGLNNGVYENEQVFNFATIDDTTINNICHL